MSDTQPSLYVVGHQKPDTDAICAAIGHSEFLQQTGKPHAQAARCGAFPERVQWVLDQAKMEAPVLLEDIRVKAGDICQKNVLCVKPTDTFLCAYDIMEQSGERSLPVIDGLGNLVGIVRFLDLLQLLMPPRAEGIAVRSILASISRVAETLNATVSGAPVDDSEETLLMLVGASSEATIEQKLKAEKENGRASQYIVFCGDRPNTQRHAIEIGARALIITGGFNLVDPELEALAKKNGTTIIRCETDTATATKLARCARLIKSVIGEQFNVVKDCDAVSSIAKRIDGLAQDILPVVNDNGCLVGVLKKSQLINPMKHQLALVDHNEFAQSVCGVEEAEIVEVIDHHRLAGDLVTREAVRFLNEPVGSSSTLIAREFRYRGLRPSKGAATCLAAGLISDTLHLTSPTTTDLDKDILGWLSEIAEIDAAEFTAGFFAVGSLLATGSVDSILNTDRKEFDQEGTKLTIAQIEELGLSAFDQRREELEAGLNELLLSGGYSIALLVVTDISTHNSMIIAAGNMDIINELPWEQKDDTLFFGKGIVSRKKQVFPGLSDAINAAVIPA